MRIENLYQEQVINQCNQNSKITNQEDEQRGKTGGKDIFEMSEEVPVMPSETYNDFAQIVRSQASSEAKAEEEAKEEDADMQMPPMPPMPPIPKEEMETEESEDSIEAISKTVKDTVNSVISAISESLGVSESEVFEALKSLQLSPSDLLNEDGLSSVVNALASNTTTASDASSEITGDETDESTDSKEETTSATMASLKELMENAIKSLQEKLGMTDEEFEEFLSSSNDFSYNMAEYTNGTMENEDGIQRFMDMMRNQGSNFV